MMNIENVHFYGNANFFGAIFEEKAYFWSVFFGKGSIFTRAVFLGKINFMEAIFNDNAAFTYAEFHSETIWENTIFKGYTCYWGAMFNDETVFIRTRIDDSICFNFVKFNSFIKFSFSECKKLVLDNCMMEKTCEINSNMGFRCLSMINCRNFGQLSIPFDWNLKRAITNFYLMDFKVAAHEFNFLKVNYNRNGEYDYEDQAYIEYRRCLRKIKKSFLGRFLDWILLDRLSCYCTKPFRVFWGALIVIFCFAGLYLIPGVVSFKKNDQRFWNSVYHSVVTFLTIGYGDSVPTGWLGLLLSGLEGFIGVFLMSLFTVSFVRKVLR